jgi:hypothetical protein
VVKAQKDGQAALEKARGKTAALRSLANAARMMDDNPNLLQLRALQAFADSDWRLSSPCNKLCDTLAALEAIWKVTHAAHFA